MTSLEAVARVTVLAGGEPEMAALALSATSSLSGPEIDGASRDITRDRAAAHF